MWRDTTIVMNAVESLHYGNLPYSDFLYPLTPVSLLWPLAIVNLFGLSVFSFVLAQSLANVVILLCAFGMARQLGSYSRVSKGLTGLFSILWLQLISATFLNVMVLPFYNYDCLLWLALAGYLYSVLLHKAVPNTDFKGYYQVLHKLMYICGILAVLSNPKIPFLPVGLLWLGLSITRKRYTAAVVATMVLVTLLLLHSYLSEVPDMAKLLNRSDGYYADFRLFTRTGMASAAQIVKAHVQIHPSWFFILLYIGYLAVRGLLKPEDTQASNRLPMACLVFAAASVYAMGAFFIHTEHFPKFEYTTLSFIVFFVIMARGVSTLNLHSVLLLYMLLRLYEPTDFFKGKHGRCLSHIQETSVLKAAHYWCLTLPMQPRLKAANPAVFSKPEEQAYYNKLQAFDTMRGFLNITQAQYPNFLINQNRSEHIQGLPHWFDTHLTTNDAVKQRLMAAIRDGRVGVVQIDRFSVYFEGLRFATECLQSMESEAGKTPELLWSGPMPATLNGDSTFIYRLKIE